MLSVSRSVIGLACGHGLKDPARLLARQTSIKYCKQLLLPFCTTSQNRQTLHETTPEKPQSMASRVRALQEKPRPFALPNLISMSRLCLTPAVSYFILNGMHSQAMMCIAAAAATDVADKMAAYLLNYNSGIQPALDFIADKVFLTTTFACLFATGFVPPWLLKGVVFRELVITLGVPLGRYLGFREPPTLRQFFDFHNYPTIGYNRKYLSSIYGTLQYALFGYYMYLGSTGIAANQVHGSWSTFMIELSLALACSMSATFIFVRLSTPTFLCRPVGQCRE